MLVQLKSSSTSSLFALNLLRVLTMALCTTYKSVNCTWLFCLPMQTSGEKAILLFYRCRFYFPVATLQASSLAFSISPLRKNREWREAGDPTHRHGEHTVLQTHPNLLAAIHVCKGSTAGRFH